MTAWLAEPSLLIAKNKRSAAQGDLRRTQQQNNSGPLSFGAVVANGSAGAAVLVGVRAGAADRRRSDSRETEKTRRAAKANRWCFSDLPPDMQKPAANHAFGSKSSFWQQMKKHTHQKLFSEDGLYFWRHPPPSWRQFIFCRKRRFQHIWQQINETSSEQAGGRKSDWKLLMQQLEQDGINSTRSSTAAAATAVQATNDEQGIRDRSKPETAKADGSSWSTKAHTKHEKKERRRQQVEAKLGAGAAEDMVTSAATAVEAETDETAKLKGPERPQRNTQ